MNLELNQFQLKICLAFKHFEQIWIIIVSLNFLVLVLLRHHAAVVNLLEKNFSPDLFAFTLSMKSNSKSKSVKFNYIAKLTNIW